MGYAKWTAAKDPDDILDYSINWGDWLGSDTISAVDWIVPPGMTMQSSEFTTTVTTIWVSGGVDGVTYSIVCRITTAAGRQVDRTVNLKVKTR